MAKDESRYTNALSGAQHRGLEIRFAASVEAGLLAARDWRPELLLVDLEDCTADCNDLIRQVRARAGSPVPVLLVVQGQIPEKEVPEIQQEGLVDFVTKPLNSPVLEYRLSNLRRTRRMLTGSRTLPAVVMYFGLHEKDDDQTPDVLLDYMSRTYQRAVELVEGQGGILHRQGGGGLIAVFPDNGRGTAGRKALTCALKMRETWNGARAEIEGQGHHPPQGGIGIARGNVSLGRVVNAALRFDMYALGDPVLRASQLQVLTRSDMVDILVDEAVQQSWGGEFRFRPVRLSKPVSKVPPLFHLEAERGAG